MDSIETIRANYERQLIHANERAEKFKYELSKRDMQIETMEFDLESLQSELTAVKEKLISETVPSGLEERFERTLNEKSELIKSLTDEISSLHEGYEFMDAELAETKASERELSKKNETLSKELFDARLTIDSQKSELSQAAMLETEHLNTISQLERLLERSEFDLSDLKDQLESKMIALKELELQNQSLHSESRTLKSQEENMLEQLEQARIRLADYENLQAKYEHLEIELGSKTKEHESALKQVSQELNDTRDKLAKCEKSLIGANEKYLWLEQESANNKVEFDENIALLSKDLSISDSMREPLESDLENANLQLYSLEREFLAAKQKLEEYAAAERENELVVKTFKEELEQTRLKLQEAEKAPAHLASVLKSALETSAENAEHLQSNLVVVVAKYDSLKQDMQILREAHSSLQTEYQTKVEQFEKLKEEQEEAVNNISRRLECSQSEIREKVQLNEDLQAQLKTITENIESLTQDNVALARAKETGDLQVDGLKKEIEELQRTIEYLESHEKDNTVKFENLTNEHAKQVELVEQQKLQMAELRDQVKTLLSENDLLAQSKAQNLELIASIDEISSTLAQTKVNLAEMTAKYESSESINKTNLQSLENAKIEISTQLETFKSKCERLLSKNEILKESLAKLQIKYDEMKQEYASKAVTSSENSDDTEKVELYKETIANLTERLQLVDSLQDQLMIVSEERDRLRRKLDRFASSTQEEPKNQLNPSQNTTSQSILKRREGDIIIRSPTGIERKKKACVVNSPLRKPSLSLRLQNLENFDPSDSQSNIPPPPPPIVKSGNDTLTSGSEKRLPPLFPATSTQVSSISSEPLHTNRRISFLSNPKARAELGPPERISASNSQDSADQKCPQQ